MPETNIIKDHETHEYVDTKHCDYCALRGEYGTNTTNKFIREHINLLEEAKKENDRVYGLSTSEKLFYIARAIPIYFKHEWWDYYFAPEEWKLYQVAKTANENYLNIRE